MPRFAPLALALLTAATPALVAQTAQKAKAPAAAHSTAGSEAVSPAKQAKAAELLSLMKTDEAVQGGLARYRDMIHQAAEQQTSGHTTTPEDKKATDAYMGQIANLQGTLDYNKFKTTLVDDYARSFTEQQLDSIIAFYKSPAGQALQTKLPDLQKEIGTMLNEKVTSLRTEFIQDTQAYRAKVAPPAQAPSLTSPSLKNKPVAPGAGSSTSPTPQQ